MIIIIIILRIDNREILFFVIEIARVTRIIITHVLLPNLFIRFILSSGFFWGGGGMEKRERERERMRQKVFFLFYPVVSEQV